MKDARLTIYPTARKVEDQLMRLSRGGCVLGHHLITLPQVVDALWLETGDRRASLSHMGERLALNEAVARARGRGAVGAVGAGMSDQMLALIRRLKSAAAISAQDWRTVIATVPAAAAARLADFTAVFAEYQALLGERGLADRHDREAAALELLHRLEASGRRPQLLEGVGQLLVAEIYDLSLLQFMTITAMIRVVGDAEVTIQAAPHKVNAIGFAELTWNRFVGEESIANQVLPDFVRRDGRSGQLGFILEHLFSDIYPLAPPADGSVTVIEAADAREEAETAARVIRRRLEEAGGKIPLERIAIVARDLTPYDDYLEAAFRRYRIPLRRELGPPLRRTIPARAILEILRLPLEGFPRESLIALCHSALMPLAAARYRALPREAGYIDQSTRPLWECFAQRRRALADALATAEGDDRDRLARRLATLERGADVWAELLEILNALATPATVASHLARLVATLERLGFDPAAASLSDSAARAAGPVWRALDEIAAAAARVAPERILPLQEFADLLETMLSETSLESTDDNGGTVRALPILEARGLDFDLVIVLGLNDGRFPQYHPENPLVADETARLVNRELVARLRDRFGARMPDAPGPILRSRSARNSEEPFLFFLALSMPARAVVLSFAREDERGRPLESSPFLAEVRARLGVECQVEKRAAGMLTPWEDCFTERDVLNSAAAAGGLERLTQSCGIAEARVASIRRRIQIEHHRADYFARPTRETLLARRQRLARKSKDWTTAAARAADEEKSSRAGEFDGRVAPDASLAQGLLTTLNGAPRPWSAGQLSEMAVCGFNFFARRILRLRDADELEHEPTRLETGDLVHRILADFFAAQPNFADPTAARETAHAVAERFRLSEAAAARDPAFFALRWTIIDEMIAEVVVHEIARRGESGEPDGLDLEYRLAFPFATGDGSDSPIMIEGWIDRLERYLDPGTETIARMRVVDYKTSRNLKSLAELLKPAGFAMTDMQMPVYLLGAATQWRERLAPDATLEASYIALQNRTKESAPLQVPRELLADAPDGLVAARVRELIADAVAGRFDVDPLECSEWCPYRPVCRFQKPAA
ncbi:MAG TPA: PD-(D/E)XK nuclease family protein [Candidatus Binataceae bacterium]|nr:PD-(D/E)XK nuclease family protein [Candidatus Binataceae bacterium]